MEKTAIKIGMKPTGLSPPADKKDGLRETDRTSATGVVCAVLMPHAPILVPEVGGENGGAATASCRAMRTAAAHILNHHPETVVVISPHSPRQARAFGLWTDDPLEGSFARFNAPHAGVDLPLDRTLVETIAAEAHTRHLETWAIRSLPLDHGALVPLWFLAEAGWSGPTVILSLNDDPGDSGLSAWGGAVAAAAERQSRRLAIVASGDMSHRLTADAPCGFHPQARQFDRLFLALLRTGNYREIENLDSALRGWAAEDVADSTLVAASAADWKNTGHRILNYEGPFGVGYAVAVLFAENPSFLTGPGLIPGKKEGSMLPALARRSVESVLFGEGDRSPPPATGGYLGEQHGVFVTIRQKDGTLRGCVGTFEPCCPDIIAETWFAARSAAAKDFRFAPVMPWELAGLRFEVSVLHSGEEVSSTAELDPLHYGVLVSTGDGRSGLLLPGIKEIATPDQQLRLARQKGGIGPEEPVTVRRFQADHFDERSEPP